MNSMKVSKTAVPFVVRGMHACHSDNFNTRAARAWACRHFARVARRAWKEDTRQEVDAWYASVWDDAMYIGESLFD